MTNYVLLCFPVHFLRQAPIFCDVNEKTLWQHRRHTVFIIHGAHSYAVLYLLGQMPRKCMQIRRRSLKSPDRSRPRRHRHKPFGVMRETFLTARRSRGDGGGFGSMVFDGWLSLFHLSRLDQRLQFMHFYSS